MKKLSHQIQNRLPLQHTQNGLVLIVALIMVLLMTIVALTSIRGSGLQEAMAGNMRDRSVAFQSCETAIREGEAVLAEDAASLPTFDGTGGYFKDLNKYNPAQSVIYWSDKDWSNNGITGTYKVQGTNSAPKYVAESVTSDVINASAQTGGAIDVAGLPNSLPREFYRVSCMGFGTTADAKVVAQSIWARSTN